MKETASNTLKIYAAKLELGPFSTLANDPSADFGEQLRYCQRFYEKSYNIGVAPGTSTDAGCVEVFTPAYMAANYATVNCSFKVEKRTTPTVTVYSITGATNCWRNTSTAADQSCGWGREGTSKFFTWVGSPAINNEYEFQWVAQCDL
jgi:hypothetical protein